MRTRLNMDEDGQKKNLVGNDVCTTCLGKQHKEEGCELNWGANELLMISFRCWSEKSSSKGKRQ